MLKTRFYLIYSIREIPKRVFSNVEQILYRRSCETRWWTDRRTAKSIATTIAKTYFAQLHCCCCYIDIQSLMVMMFCCWEQFSSFLSYFFFISALHLSPLAFFFRIRSVELCKCVLCNDQRSCLPADDVFLLSSRVTPFSMCDCIGEAFDELSEYFIEIH